MDAAREGPSRIGAPGFAVPERAANLPINADMFGFNSALIPRSACPSPISVPLIREAQEGKASKNVTTRKIFFIIMLTITKMNVKGNMEKGSRVQGSGFDRADCLTPQKFTPFAALMSKYAFLAPKFPP